MNPDFSGQLLDLVNPFDASTLATGDDLFGRDDELDWLSQRLSAGANLLLFGPDGMGKSSLLQQAGSQFASQQGGFFIRLDLSIHQSTADVARVIDLAAASIGSGAYSSGLGGLLGDAPAAGLSGLGIASPPFVGTGAGVNDTFLSSLQNLNTVSQSRRLSVAVAFDSAQELRRLGGGPLQTALLDSAQRCSALRFMFATSEQAVVGQSTESLRTLHAVLESRRVGPLDPYTFSQWIDRRFANAKCVTRSVGATCVDLGGPSTADIIGLAQQTFDLSARARFANEATVRSALDQSVIQQSGRFAAIWQTLSDPERKLLGVIARNNAPSFDSLDAFRNVVVQNSAEFKATLSHLTEKRLIDPLGAGRFRITSAVFKRWSMSAGLTMSRTPGTAVAPGRATRFSFGMKSAQSASVRQFPGV